MYEILGVLRYEYLMQIRRYGLWISMVVFSGIFYWFFLTRLRGVPGEILGDSWRFPRDLQLHMRDTLRSVLRSNWPLVIGRCTGSLLAALTPQLVLLLAALIY